MQIGQDLLAVGVADRDRADSGADHTQRRLVQVGRQDVERARRRRLRRAARTRRRGASHRWIGVPLARTASSDSAHQPRWIRGRSVARPSPGWRGGSKGARSRPRPASSEPAGRLDRPRCPARQLEATSTPSSGPSDVRSHRRVQRSSVSGSCTSPRAIAASSPHECV